jgi:hypothetical protein
MSNNLIKKNFGGDRLGSGKKMEVALHNFLPCVILSTFVSFFVDFIYLKIGNEFVFLVFSESHYGLFGLIFSFRLLMLNFWPLKYTVPSFIRSIALCSRSSSESIQRGAKFRPYPEKKSNIEQ